MSNPYPAQPDALRYYNYDYENSDQSNYSAFAPDQQWNQFEYQGDAQTEAHGYTGSIMAPAPINSFTAPAPLQNSIPGTDPENEPPLLEELEINFDHIRQKTLSVLNPFRTPNHDIMEDTDMAGPLVFLLVFGGTLLLSGKMHFGFLYGFGTIGCVAMYALLNLMCHTSVSVGCVISVLGYCLLPMIALSTSAAFIPITNIFGWIFAPTVVTWCALSAANLFTSALNAEGKKALIAYPCIMVYSLISLITLF